MKKMFTTQYWGKFLLMFIFILLPAASTLADSAWQWEMSLYVNIPGEAMYMPSAVAFDPVGERYYAVDTGNNRLVSFDREGKLLKAFNANERLQVPFDMIRFDNGQLWVVEKGRNSLTRINVRDQKVEPHTLFDGDQLVFPDRIARVGEKIYILDRASGKVLRLNNNLEIEQHFGCSDCLGVFVDFTIENNSVWALDTMGKKVYQFSSDGSIAKTIPLGEEVDFPVSLAFGSSDSSIYILDRHQNRVAVYGRDGRFQYHFLGLGQGPQNLYFPRELRFDPWGNLCIVDEGNGRIEVFTR